MILEIPVSRIPITWMFFAALFCDVAHASSAPLQQLYIDEVAQLRAQLKVRQAFSFLENELEQSAKDLIVLNEIPSPPFKEQARAARFAKYLTTSGLSDVWIDEVGNVIGRRPGTRGDKTIAYSAHLDTVFPEGTDVKVRREKDKYFAPGIGDNSRGLVAVLEVLRALQFAAIQTEADILFIGNVGEEGLGDLRGVKYLFREDSKLAIDTLIAIDGGNSQRIVYGGVGSHRYRVKFLGPGGHSWGAFGMANPHHALGRGIHYFIEKADQLTSQGEKTSYNVGRIGGGTSVNSIPFESWLEVDLRSGNQNNLDKIDKLFRQSMKVALEQENEARRLGPPLALEVAQVGDRPAALGDSNSKLVQRALAATASFGIRPSLEISSTDANTPISKGIPAITLSRGGRSGRAHSLDEWWQDVDSYRSVQIGILVLLAEAGLVQ